MILPSLSPFAFKSLSSASRFNFGAALPKIKTVIESKNNPNKQPELRGQQQLELHMTDYAKDFYYIHSKTRRPFTLYSIFAALPTSVTNHFANLVQDPKAAIASDQLHLPKISENSIPVYESLSAFPTTLRIIHNTVIFIPFYTALTAVMPFIAFTTMAMHYLVYFRSSYKLAAERLVVKMELLPETEEIIFQKVSLTGGVKASRVSISDIEQVNPDTEPNKYTRDLVFQRSMRSAINIDIVFRVKSTGEILMFDREGVWHEEGLNHELMP